jgi:hypothetical protein
VFRERDPADLRILSVHGSGGAFYLGAQDDAGDLEMLKAREVDVVVSLGVLSPLASESTEYSSIDAGQGWLTYSKKFPGYDGKLRVTSIHYRRRMVAEALLIGPMQQRQILIGRGCPGADAKDATSNEMRAMRVVTVAVASIPVRDVHHRQESVAMLSQFRRQRCCSRTGPEDDAPCIKMLVVGEVILAITYRRSHQTAAYEQ